MNNDSRLRHGPAERIVEDWQLHPGQPQPSADEQQHHEEQQEQLHRAIMPQAGKSSPSWEPMP
jgi:hypothetical protein